MAVAATVDAPLRNELHISAQEGPFKLGVVSAHR